MHRNLSRHRKLRTTRTVATRTAVSAGAAAAALLLSAGGATAATAPSAGDTVITDANAVPGEPPCTGTPLDGIIGPYIGSTCGSGEGGGPGDEETPPPDGGTPPPPPM